MGDPIASYELSRARPQSGEAVEEKPEEDQGQHHNKHAAEYGYTFFRGAFQAVWVHGWVVVVPVSSVAQAIDCGISFRCNHGKMWQRFGEILAVGILQREEERASRKGLPGLA